MYIYTHTHNGHKFNGYSFKSKCLNLMRYWSAQSLDTSGDPETFQRDKKHNKSLICPFP